MKVRIEMTMSEYSKLCFELGMSGKVEQGVLMTDICLTLEKLLKTKKLMEEADFNARSDVPYYMSRKAYESWEAYKPGFILQEIKKHGHSHIEITEKLTCI